MLRSNKGSELLKCLLSLPVCVCSANAVVWNLSDSRALLCASSVDNHEGLLRSVTDGIVHIIKVREGKYENGYKTIFRL